MAILSSALRVIKRLQRTRLQQGCNILATYAHIFGQQQRLWSSPLMLDICPTKRCNLNCIFCIKYETAGGHEMELATFQKIARMLFPYAEKAAFCSGGEPLLNRHILEFLRITKRYNLQTWMTTNGMLMNDEIARALIKDCYMYLLNFSFDAATKETLESIRRGARYETVLANIEKVKRAKMDAGAELPCLAIRFAAMKRNIHELPSLVDLAKKVGIEKITVEYLLVTEETPPEESLFFHQNLARRYFQEAAVKAQEKGIVLELPEPMDTKLQTPRKCDMPWTFIKIDTDGTARFCYKSWDRPIGNVLKVNDFKELWNCPRYQAIRKTVNTQEPFFLYCKICSARWGRSEAYHHIQKPSEAVAGLYCFKGEKGSG